MTAECKGTVLVVDDDHDIREITALILESLGHKASTAEDGEQALELLHGEAGRPCLILLDLMMPVMDGWKFRAVQSHDPKLAEIPVVVLSGVSDVAAGAASLGVAEFVAKPLTIERLEAILAKYCTC